MNAKTGGDHIGLVHAQRFAIHAIVSSIVCDRGARCQGNELTGTVVIVTASVTTYCTVDTLAD